MYRLHLLIQHYLDYLLIKLRQLNLKLDFQDFQNHQIGKDCHRHHLLINQLQAFRAYPEGYKLNYFDYLVLSVLLFFCRLLT